MIKLAITLLIAAASFGAPPQAAGGGSAKNVNATIDATQTGAPISPYIYGQFIEHIGDLVNRSLWSEMIDDRKFYYPIVANPGEQKPVRGRRANRWLPLGPETSVIMDREHP